MDSSNVGLFLEISLLTFDLPWRLWLQDFPYVPNNNFGIFPQLVRSRRGGEEVLAQDNCQFGRTRVERVEALLNALNRNGIVIQSILKKRIALLGSFPHLSLIHI